MREGTDTTGYLSIVRVSDSFKQCCDCARKHVTGFGGSSMRENQGTDVKDAGFQQVNTHITCSKQLSARFF